MKNLTLLLAVLLLWGCVKAQIPNFSLLINSLDTIVKSTKHEVIFKESESSKWGNYIIILNDLIEYETECLSDTLVGTKYESDYIEDCYIFDEFEVMLTLEQLNEFGYEYQYERAINTNKFIPIEFEYYFVKEPTFKGFIKWLKNMKL